MPMHEIKTHHRVNDILLGPLERPALKWLAAHMPPWASPDLMTVVGVLGAALIFASYVLTRSNNAFLWLANLGFVINWLGDSLDGTLARHRHIQRPRYGFFVDHTVDAFNEVLIFLGLGISPFVRLEIAMLALIGYLLMSVLVFVRTCVVGTFQLSYGKLGPTEARLIAILANTLVYFFGNPGIRLFAIRFTFYDLVGIVIVVLLFFFFMTTLYKQALELSREDRPGG